jgi:hypothetical protein
MAFERHALLAHLAQIRQRPDLKAAGIGQDRLVPAHEMMQAAQPLHPLRPGPQHQVIGIAQKDIGTRLAT